MIKFFRKIRQKLISKNRLRKYLIYALGEIVLVVIGILIALQLNNINQQKKDDEEYKAVLKQIYTAVDQDIEEAFLNESEILKQIEIIENIQQNPERINKNLLPHLLFYLDLEPTYSKSEVPYLLNFLRFNPQNQEQSYLNKRLSSYGRETLQDYYSKRNDITSMLKELNIPYPFLEFGYSAINNYENIDTTFFNDHEINKVIRLLENPRFQIDLKTLKSVKSTNLFFVQGLVDFASTTKSQIKYYYPEAKLLYSNIGIIGNATEYGSWEKSVPLKLTNELESIWEGNVFLNEGFIKFREGENWYFNWGGVSFPKGNTISYGDNIKVKKGNYHLILNLSKKTYEFILINE